MLIPTTPIQRGQFHKWRNAHVPATSEALPSLTWNFHDSRWRLGAANQQSAFAAPHKFGSYRK